MIFPTCHARIIQKHITVVAIFCVFFSNALPAQNSLTSAATATATYSIAAPSVPNQLSVADEPAPLAEVLIRELRIPPQVGPPFRLMSVHYSG